jgi:hypothetical protein
LGFSLCLARDTSQFGGGGGFVLHTRLNRSANHPPTNHCKKKTQFPREPDFKNRLTTHFKFIPAYVETTHPVLNTTRETTSPRNTFIFPANMENIYNSPFIYGPGPYYTTTTHDPYTAPFECPEHEGGNTLEPDHNTVIEQLAREHIASGDRSWSWAEEVEMGVDWTPQGEYRPASYSPPPAPPSPTCWVPPSPPTPVCRPPKAQFPPHHGWYNPSRTQDQPQCTPFRPHPFPTPSPPRGDVYHPETEQVM